MEAFAKYVAFVNKWRMLKMPCISINLYEKIVVDALSRIFSDISS